MGLIFCAPKSCHECSSLWGVELNARVIEYMSYGKRLKLRHAQHNLLSLHSE
jgi:hypothetical protein